VTTLEPNLLADIESQRAAILAFTTDLIATPSPTPPGDESAIAEFVIANMGRLGLRDARIVGPSPKRSSVLWRSAAPRPGPRIALNGHIDTKPVGDPTHWRTDPLVATIVDGELYGLGSSDMKAAVAAMVYAAAAFERLHPDHSGELGLILTADEEGGMGQGAHYLLDNGFIDYDAIIIGEPSGIRTSWEQLDVVSRGFTALKVMVGGTQMHSSLTDVMPSRNASVLLAGVLSRFRSEFKLPYEPHPYCPQGVTVNPGVTLKGGVFYGVNPGRAEFGVDIRIPPGLTKSDVQAAMDRFVEAERASDPDLEISWAFEGSPLDWITPTEISADHMLVKAARHASLAVLGREPPLGAFPGGTEAAVYQGRGGIPALPALGPGYLPVCHGPNEHVGVESIIEAAKIYALMLEELLP
jgi:acetylornithine deacetylase/succinyl-diaminopimelate desuccinylase-like protein